MHQVGDGFRVQHDGLDLILGDLDLDVLVDELQGLGAEGVPDETAGDVGQAHGLVDVGEPPVVGLVGSKHGIRADDLPQLRDHAVGESERVLGRGVGKGCLGLYEALVAADSAVHAGEERKCNADCRSDLGLQLLDVGDDLLDALVVKRQRPGHIIEDAEVVDDQPVGLVRRVDPVGARDRLEQGVLL